MNCFMRLSSPSLAHGRDPDDPRFGGDGGGDFPFIEGEGVSVVTEDGVTYVKVTARFVLENGAPFDSENVLNRWELGIEEHWSGTFDGETIRTDLVIDQSAAYAVTVPVRRGVGRSQHGLWFSGASGYTAAHEFGHILA